jgi:hypothetical protein
MLWHAEANHGAVLGRLKEAEHAVIMARLIADTAAFKKFATLKLAAFLEDANR